MRFKCFLLLTGLGLIFGPAAGAGQLRGESGEGGERRAPARVSTDLNERWKQLAGNAAVWRRADLTDPHRQFIFDLVADKLQCANGEITKEQFLAMTRRPATERSDGAAKANPGGSEKPKAAERVAAKSATPSAAGHPEGEDDSRPAPGAEAEFRKRDVNGDGLLDYDEMDDALRAERDRWDTNGDGFIDLDEFKAYFKARTRHERAVARAAGPKAAVEGKPARPAPALAPLDLPPNLPDWFRQYDTDGDGQIGLYEWKAADQPIARFLAMDFNGDGFLTPDEVLGPAPVKEETKENKEPPKVAQDAPRNDQQQRRNAALLQMMLNQSINGGGVKIRFGNPGK